MNQSCPVCSRTFPTERSLSHHFRHRREAGDHPHITYEIAQEDARWAHLTEGVDYVRCLECGHRTVTLARHLKGEHGITADQYRVKHGDVPIRCDALKAKRSVAIANRPITKGDVKGVVCPSCGTSWQGSKYLGTIHDLRCEPCREREDWAGKTEPRDYVTCRACGYRAGNLTSHLQNNHPELVGKYRDVYQGALVIALGSKILDKVALRGLKRPVEFGRKVSRGKLACRYRHSLASRMLMSMSKKASDKMIRFGTTDLLRFRRRNGKVSLGDAIVGLGRSYQVVRRECLRHGIVYYNRLVSQGRFLALLSKILGASHHQEWSSDQFTNPRTGKRFRFDGYFPDLNLLVEFHGRQHYVYPTHYHHTEDEYLDLQWRDAEKNRQVLSTTSFRYLEVREDDPWQDEAFLRERLRAAGVPA